MHSSKKIFHSFPATVVFFLVFHSVIPIKIAAQDSLAFGDRNWVSEALMGRIYFLPDTTHNLPNFDTLKVQGTVYAKKIDVPVRHWTTGFPGVPGRNQWFAVVYTGQFKVKKPGKYFFRLMSDDGAKLFIDKKLVIDNDGIHGPNSRLGEIKLDDSKHSIRVEYFQGPPTEIALQLFATLEKENEQNFSSENFVFITPPKNKAWVTWLIYLGAGLLMLLIIYAWIRKK